MGKEILLLSKAMDFDLEKSNAFEYSFEEQINYTEKDGNKMPTILIEMSGPTHSKTLQAPSDDDPDL